MKRGLGIVAATVVILMAGSPGCSTTHSSTAGGGQPVAMATLPAEAVPLLPDGSALPQTASYSGPLTDLTQLVGTWIRTSANLDVAIIDITKDGKMIITRMVGWGPDDMPLMGNLETATTSVLGGGRLAITRSSGDKNDTQVLSVMLNGSDLEITSCDDSHGLQYFHNVQQVIDAEYVEVASRIQRLQMELGAEGENIGTGFSAKSHELQTLIDESLKADQSAADATSKLDLFNSQINFGLTPPEVQEQYQHDPEYIDYRRMVDEAEITVKMDENSDPANSVALKTEQQRLQLLHQKLDQLSDMLKNNTVALVRSQLEAEVKSARGSQVQCKKQCDELKADITQISNHRYQLEELKAEAQAKGKMLQHIHNKIDELSISGQFAAGEHFRRLGTGETIIDALRAERASPSTQPGGRF